MTPQMHVAQNLLLEAHPIDVAVGIFKDKVLHKPLHLRPTSPDLTSQDARAKRRLRRLREKEKSTRRQKVRPLSAKEKRRIGIHDASEDTKRHEIYKPLHNMWLEYMREILGLAEQPELEMNVHNIGTRLASADYHGAQVMVVRSRCASIVGFQGIVVRDTKFTFQIITRKNELKIIPKRHTVFRLEIPRSRSENEREQENTKEINSERDSAVVFEIHGSQFEYRAADRATKKFKQRDVDDL